jgi:hypothetical protein
MRRLLLTFVALLAIVGLLSGAPLSTRAQEMEAQPAFVYGINAAVPGSYVGTFAPPSTATIYLLAGQVSILSPRRTEIYFWPITNEYRANWHTLNEPVPGTLEVSQHGAVVASRAPTDYTIHFTPHESENAASAELFLGQAAIDADASFRAKQEAFQKASTAYYEAERAWTEAASEASRKAQAGETVDVPPEPQPPAPIGVFSNGLNKGIPIDLEPGEYQIRLRGPDGEIVPDSERALTVFAARQTAVGYTVVPETRWTTPLESPAPDDVIVGAAGSTLYLEPHQAREYPAQAWTLLQNPQRLDGATGGWQWVTGERLTDATLEVVAGGRVVAQQALTPFKVKQLPGSQLGYEVETYTPDAANPSAAPDFEAFPLHLDKPGAHLQIRLISAQGAVMPGSPRQVSAPMAIPLPRVFLLSLAPLVVGALMGARRWRLPRIVR